MNTMDDLKKTIKTKEVLIEFLVSCVKELEVNKKELNNSIDFDGSIIKVLEKVNKVLRKENDELTNDNETLIKDNEKLIEEINCITSNCAPQDIIDELNEEINELKKEDTLLKENLDIKDKIIEAYKKEKIELIQIVNTLKHDIKSIEGERDRILNHHIASTK
jgi:chromosome segregation ATPase